MIKELLEGKKARDVILNESFQSWLDDNWDNDNLRNLYNDAKVENPEMTFEDFAYEYYTQMDPNERETTESKKKTKGTLKEGFKTPKYFSVSGYWKDDKSEFDGYIIKMGDVDEDEDDDIFYYVDSLNDLESLKTEGVNDFVITDYEEIQVQNI